MVNVISLCGKGEEGKDGGKEGEREVEINILTFVGDCITFKFLHKWENRRNLSEKS